LIANISDKLSVAWFVEQLTQAGSKAARMNQMNEYVMAVKLEKFLENLAVKIFRER